MFKVNFPIRGIFNRHFSVQNIPIRLVFPYAYGRGMTENSPNYAVLLFRPTEHPDHGARAVFLHADRNCIDFDRAGFEDPVCRITDFLRCHIIHIQAELIHGVRLIGIFSEDGTHAVGGRKVLCPGSIPDLLNRHRGEFTKVCCKMPQ